MTSGEPRWRFAFALDSPQNVETVTVGQPDVEKDCLVRDVAEHGECFASRSSSGDGVILFAQDRFQRFADVGFVVNDQNVIHRAALQI